MSRLLLRVAPLLFAAAVVSHTGASSPSHNGQKPQSIPLVVVEPAGVARAGENVTSGVPLPIGAIKTPANVRLVDEKGNELPLQARVQSRWKDGSVRWLLLDFPCSVGAKLARRLSLQYGANVAMRAQTAKEKAVLADTSVYGFNCRGAELEVDGKKLDQPTVAAADKQQPQQDEAAGQTRRLVKLTSTDFIDATFRSQFSLNARTWGAVGSPGQISSLTLSQVSDKPTLKITRWDMPLLTDVTLSSAVFGSDTAPVRIPIRKGDKIELRQTARDKYMLARNGQTVASGKRCPGWLTVVADGVSHTLAVADFAEQHPLTLAVSTEGVVLKCATSPVELRKGVDKTITFFSLEGDSGTNGEAAARAFEAPLRAVAPPIWYARTGVLGPIMDAGPAGKTLSLHVEKKVRSLLAARPTGLLSWGGPPANTPEGDFAGALLETYLRTGERHYLTTGLAAAWFVADLSTDHSTGAPLAGPANPGQTIEGQIEGLTLASYLTGDPRGFETAKKIAQSARRLSSTTIEGTAAARVLSTLSIAYASFRDERVLSSAGRLAAKLAKDNLTARTPEAGADIVRALECYMSRAEDYALAAEVLEQAKKLTVRTDDTLGAGYEAALWAANAPKDPILQKAADELGKAQLAACDLNKLNVLELAGANYLPFAAAAPVPVPVPQKSAPARTRKGK